MKKIFVVLAVGMLTGCASWQDTSSQTQQTEEENISYFVVDDPYELQDYYVESSIPQLYSIIASRATNKMLDQTADVYEKPISPKLYVMQVKKTGIDHVPDGFFYSRQVTKEIIDGSKTFTLVNNRDEADYLLEVVVNHLSIQDIPGNALQYKMILYDKNNNEVGSWTESIRQVQNDDRSWW